MHKAITEKSNKYFNFGILLLERNKKAKDKIPATADLPKVINSGDSSLLLGPKAIFVAVGVIEKIIIPTNP